MKEEKLLDGGVTKTEMTWLSPRLLSWNVSDFSEDVRCLLQDQSEKPVHVRLTSTCVSIVLL